MGLFDIFKSKKKENINLLESLFLAIKEENEETFKDLCLTYQEEIAEKFPTWRVLPQEFLNDPTARNTYVEYLLFIAKFFQQEGDHRLIDILMKSGEEQNPIKIWQEDLLVAQSLIYDGKIQEVVDLLHTVIEKNSELRGGSAVADYLPKTLGMLGLAYFKLGNKDKAIEYMFKAKYECELNGDKNGVNVYNYNLQFLQQQNMD